MIAPHSPPRVWPASAEPAALASAPAPFVDADDGVDFGGSAVRLTDAGRVVFARRVCASAVELSVPRQTRAAANRNVCARMLWKKANLVPAPALHLEHNVLPVEQVEHAEPEHHERE